MPQNVAASTVAADKLYRNEGVPLGESHPVFKDVSLEAGINENGYGLGITVSDFNNDGWPDIYVANDFISNDLLWLNNKNGTFSNCIKQALHHQSFNSMGVDAADINNDGMSDVAVLDMLPETNERKKTMFAGSNPERYDMEQSQGGYQPEFTRNMLQLNNGTRQIDSAKEPFFSEIGQLAGISETDWSWSVLMADFDNDGRKDMHITNGIAKDLTNNDFLFFRSGQNGNSFSGNEPPTNILQDNSIAALRKELDAYGEVKVDNYFYHNNGNLTFSNYTDTAGLAIPSISHGAAYADLDNDGDLDLIINNMNQEAFVWRNETRKSAADSTHNFLTVQLNGSALNKNGFGTKATLYVGGEMQFLEQFPVRGYLSSVDNRLHFGIGNISMIDSLKIVWPDEKVQVLHNIKANRIITINYKDATLQPTIKNSFKQTCFSDAASELNIHFKHNETFYFDYGQQRVLPQKYSQLGPPIAAADVNGDGLTDFFAGGAYRQPGKIFIQNSNGTFSSKDITTIDKTSEDIGAVFFDADNDKDTDLVVTEGSYEFGSSSTVNQPRLYKNDGRGNFSLDIAAFAHNITTVAQAVTVGDYDSDGDMDIFIGGRVSPGNYPQLPHSYILQNNKGKFTDVTKEICPSLAMPGMLTAAMFTDFNGDKKPDLIICGEWMPVRFFENKNGKFNEVTGNTGLQNNNGIWRSLQSADIDGDGDMDYIAGNMGLNNKYHADKKKPIMMYAKDIDGNGFQELIPAYYIKNNTGAYELFPGIDRMQLAEELPAIKKQYLLNADYAKVSMAQLVSDIGNKDLTELKCETTASMWIENLGGGKFKAHQLPVEAQFAPVNAILAKDIDGDGKVDLLLAGNEYQTEISTGRYDASYGCFLKGNGEGSFKAVQQMQSGFIIDGDVKNMRDFQDKKSGTIVLATVNNDSLRCFKINAGLANNW